MTKKTREQTPYTTVDDDNRSMICASKRLVEGRPITEVAVPLLVVERGRSALGESRPKLISVKYPFVISLVKGT